MGSIRRGNRDSDSTRLHVGVMLPTIGRETSPDAIARIAESAESVGFDSAWVGDHVAFPATIEDEYPFSPSGDPPPTFGADSNLYSPLETLSFVAGSTESLSLGTNVCLAPLYHPVVLAKRVLTTGALANWQFQFGVGLGWLETEYQVLDVPVRERGSRLDEFLALFERAQTRGRTAFDGPHHSFQEIGFHPVPPSEESVPIWVGGKSSATFRRVGEYGDGWTTVEDSPAQIEAASGRLERAWSDFDRSGDPRIALTNRLDVREDGGHEGEGELVGTASAVASTIDEYRDAGVTHLILMFTTSTVAEQEEQIDRFVEDVLPRVDG